MEEDLPWVLSLKQQKEKMVPESDDTVGLEGPGPVHLVEIVDSSGERSEKSVELWKKPKAESGESSSSSEAEAEKTLRALPKNYIYMRR